jgi:hypothetical protein
MKKLLSLLTITLVAFAMAFVGCKKDDKNDDGGGGGTGGGGGGTNGFVIEAKNVLNSSSTIKKVEAFMEESFGGERITLDKVSYSNNSFKVEIPNTVDSKFLPTTLGDANTGDLNIEALDNTGSDFGFFVQESITGSCRVSVIYFYSDADCEWQYYSESTIGGVTHTNSQELSVKKGWNIRYLKQEGTATTSTTVKPTGINLQWTFTSYID